MLNSHTIFGLSLPAGRAGRAGARGVLPAEEGAGQQEEARRGGGRKGGGGGGWMCTLYVLYFAVKAGKRSALVRRGGGHKGGGGGGWVVLSC